MYVDAESGNVVKVVRGNELKFYTQCWENPEMAPWLEIIPAVEDRFTLRKGIDVIDLTQMGISEAEMHELIQTIQGKSFLHLA